MAVNLKMTIIAVAVVGIVGSGYFVYSASNNRQEVINEHLDKLSKNLPKQFKFEKQSSEEGLFSSSGSYRLSFNSPLDKKYNGAIIIDYEASHGLTSLFTGRTNFVGTTKLEGSITKELKIKSADNVLSKLEGTIDSQGNLSLKEIGNEVSFVLPVNGNETNFKVKSFSDEITYASDSGEIQKNLTLPEIKGVDSIDANITYTLKNSEIKYSSNINMLKHNKLSVKIAQLDIPSEHLKAEGIVVNKSSEDKAKKTVIKFDTKINKLNSVNYKDATFELKSSLDSVNKDLFAVYDDILPLYLLNHKVSSHKSFSDAIQGGLTFNIEKFSIKSALEKANTSGKIEILPPTEGKIFSLAEQTKIDLTIDSDSVLLEKFIDPNSINTSTSTDNSNISININYAEKKLKVNDIPTQEKLTNSLIDLLSQLEKDNKLGLSLSTTEEVKEDIKLEEVKPQEETKKEDIKSEEAKQKEVKKEDKK